MSGYTKLFNSILASTIWRADDKTRLVWITMLAMADRHGFVAASVPGLADFARVSLPDCQKALLALASPDEWSRSKENDGRRIQVEDGGWILLNHSKYREKMGSDERREYLKLKQREYRRKQKSTNVNKVSDTDTQLTHAEAEAEAEAAPTPKAKKISQVKNKLISEVVAATKGNGNGSGNGSANGDGLHARSRRPIFSGQRFVVFDWMLEDMTRTLGSYTDDFDLHAWFFDLDASAVKNNLVIPRNDQWPWLQTALTQEARTRGLPFATNAPQSVSDIGRQNIANAHGAVARIQGRK